MKTIACLLGVFAFLAPASGTGEDSPLLLAHYMPWYATKAVSGTWGWHWTMDRFDPEKIDEKGEREIASHDYPLVG